MTESLIKALRGRLGAMALLALQQDWAGVVDIARQVRIRCENGPEAYITWLEGGQAEAFWRTSGKYQIYCVPIEPGSKEVERLGWVWQRNSSKHHKWRNDDGMEVSEQQAKNKILEGWK